MSRHCGEALIPIDNRKAGAAGQFRAETFGAFGLLTFLTGEEQRIPHHDLPYLMFPDQSLYGRQICLARTAGKDSKPLGQDAFRIADGNTYAFTAKV